MEHHVTLKKVGLKFVIILILIILYIPSNAQSTRDINNFSKFVIKNYNLPDTLKNDCEWMYAIVKVKTDIHNKIIKYDFVNEPPLGMGRAFDFLIGYQFSQKMKIKGHPVVFYFSIDNSEICIPKEGEKRFYAPNQAVETIMAFYYKIFKDDPQTVIIPGLIIKAFYPRQQ